MLPSNLYTTYLSEYAEICNVDNLISNLKKMSEDIKAIYRNDPSIGGIQFLLYPGLWAITMHRYIAHPLYKIGAAIKNPFASSFFKFSALFFSQMARLLTQIEIHPGAQIGKGFFIDHGNGVVIGETAQLGDYCSIFHGVTIGGTGNHTGKRHPTIGNHVFIGNGATLLGPIKVGNNVKIGARTTVVMHNIPSNCTVVDSPARIVKINGIKVNLPLEKTNVDRVPKPEIMRQHKNNIGMPKHVCYN